MLFRRDLSSAEPWDERNKDLKTGRIRGLKINIKYNTYNINNIKAAELQGDARHQKSKRTGNRDGANK